MNRILHVVVCLAVSANLAHAKDDNPAYTTVESAGRDYQIQGEYQGTVKPKDSRWGAHVIALGDGKFHAVGYPGGLPGDGWSKGDERKHVDGELQGDVATFDAGEFQLQAGGGQMKVVSAAGDLLGVLKRVERKSPTLGAKPPKGAVVLFDGSSLDKWNNGKLVDKKYLGATAVFTKRVFGDHTLHLEFRTPFMPKSTGQARGNSGVYVQSRYEVQVLDSFGLEGKDNECGGIYSISEPKLNMCFPPLAWQTYDVQFTAARYNAEGEKVKNGRVTMKHNGVVIHNDLELKHGTPGRHEEGPTKDGLYLQNHGNPVVYRNIWVVEK